MNRLKMQGFLVGKFATFAAATLVAVIFFDAADELVVTLGIGTAVSGFLALWNRIGRIEDAQARGYRAALRDMRTHIDVSRAPDQHNLHRLPSADATLRVTKTRKR
jgi:hypothetical protein